jgi:hypothetical protein
MSRPELTNGVWVVRVISWVIWSFLISGMLIYIQLPSLGINTINYDQRQFHILVGCSIPWGLFLLAIVFILQYFGLKKPAVKGSYHPFNLKGIVRLALLSLVIWLIIDLLAATGIVLFLLSGKAWTIYTWTSVGLVSMCYFSPRLKPYEKAMPNFS